MNNYEINGQIIVNGKIKRYTACIATRFAKFLNNEHAIACAIILDLIGAEKIKYGEEQQLLIYGMSTMDDIATMFEHIETVRAERKTRVMSEETKRNNYEKQLAKLKQRYGVED